MVVERSYTINRRISACVLIALRGKGHKQAFLQNCRSDESRLRVVICLDREFRSIV